MSKRDYYETLGVARNVSDDELKKAYRKMAVQYHPDRNPGDKEAESKFKEVNEAYQILSDPKKRSMYDQFGHAGFQGFEQGFGGGAGPGSFSDIFDNIFGDIFGSQATRSSGIDLRYNLEITFEEAAFGVERKITFEKDFNCESCRGSGAKAGTKPKACSSCRGTGQVRFNQGFFTLARTCPQCQGRGTHIEEKCPDCKGKGKRRKAHSVTVKVPAGIDTDQRLRLRGEGEIGDPGGEAGDLYVIVRVREHSLYKRENEHVILDLPITFTQAALGADIEIPTLHGQTTLEVKAGTQAGETLRLKGKGIRRLNGSGHGDQFVRLSIEVPTALNSKQKDLLRQFDKECKDEAHPGVTSFLKKFKEIFKA